MLGNVLQRGIRFPDSRGRRPRIPSLFREDDLYDLPYRKSSKRIPTPHSRSETQALGLEANRDRRR